MLLALRRMITSSCRMAMILVDLPIVTIFLVQFVMCYKHLQTPWCCQWLAMILVNLFASTLEAKRMFVLFLLFIILTLIRIITQVGLKLDIMKLMTHENPEVKRQALFAIQKTMVTNWEYLAKAK